MALSIGDLFFLVVAVASILAAIVEFNALDDYILIFLYHFVEQFKICQLCHSKYCLQIGLGNLCLRAKFERFIFYFGYAVF